MRDSTTVKLRVVIARISIFILAVSQFLTLGQVTPVARAQTAVEVDVCVADSTYAPCDYTTINSAINGTSAGDTVYVLPGTYYEDFGISQDRNVIGLIDPLNPALRDPNQITVIGDTGSPAVQVTGGAIALIDGLTIKDSGSSKDDGGGIKVSSGAHLTLLNAVVSNSLARNGGAIHVSNNSSLEATDVVMRNNTAVRDGGGLHQDPDSTVVLTRVTIDSNSSADNGGGAYLHGTAVLTITDSTVSNNTGGVDGGPADGYGAGIAVVDGASLSMTNSTVSGNSSDASGGGIASLGRDPSTVLLNNVTVAFNATADDGGGLFRDKGGFTASNTIISDNTASSGPDCAGTFVSAGSNLIGDAAGCDGFSVGTDLPGGVAALDPVLTLNAPGTTATHALTSGSDAIDAGNTASCELADQRGVLRDSACDIGAYEWLEPSISLTKTATLNDPDGNGFPEAGETITYSYSSSEDGSTTTKKIYEYKSKIA